MGYSFPPITIELRESIYENNYFIWLTYFKPMLHFSTPWKRQKTRGFLMFSGSIEMKSDLKWVKEEAIKKNS